MHSILKYGSSLLASVHWRQPEPAQSDLRRAEAHSVSEPQADATKRVCSSSLTGEGVCDCVPAVRRHTKGYDFYTDTDSGDVTARFLKFLWIPLNSLAKLKKNSGVASRKRSRWDLLLFVREMRYYNFKEVPRQFQEFPREFQRLRRFSFTRVG